MACTERLKKTLCKKTRKSCRKREKWEREGNPRVRARRPIGDRVAQGKKSVAFSLTMRAEDQTLTDEHAEATVKAILTALEKEYGAVIR